MKENNEDYSDSFTKKYIGGIGYQPNFFERKNDDIISPFKSDRKEMQNNYNNSPSILNSFSRNITNENNTTAFNNYNYNCNYLYDNYQFTRKNLPDEEKKYFQPRDSSFIDKLLDFLLNW